MLSQTSLYFLVKNLNLFTQFSVWKAQIGTDGPFLGKDTPTDHSFPAHWHVVPPKSSSATVYVEWEYFRGNP